MTDAKPTPLYYVPDLRKSHYRALTDAGFKNIEDVLSLDNETLIARVKFLEADAIIVRDLLQSFVRPK